jgi:hypothetical protein
MSLDKLSLPKVDEHGQAMSSAAIVQQASERFSAELRNRMERYARKRGEAGTVEDMAEELEEPGTGHLVIVDHIYLHMLQQQLGGEASYGICANSRQMPPAAAAFSSTSATAPPMEIASLCQLCSAQEQQALAMADSGECKESKRWELRSSSFGRQTQLAAQQGMLEELGNVLFPCLCCVCLL